MLNSNFEPYFQELENYLELRDLAKNTRRSYRSFLRSYLAWISETLAVSPEEVTYDDIRSYLLFLKRVQKLSNHTINAHSSLIRFFRLFILKQGWSEFEVPRMRYTTALPFVLSKEEVFAFIDSIPNLKHKAFVALLYSSGLRISEVCHLRYEDVHRKDKRLFIRCSKNRSDRYALLSEATLDILTDYWRTHGKPREWLFPSRKLGFPIATYTGSVCIREHLQRLGWTCPVTSHTFRHSFATHLYEQGADLLMIQKHLGHRSIHSTTIYVHLARAGLGNVISPFDVR